MGLARNRRMRRSADFRRTIKHGRKKADRLLVMAAAQSPADGPQFGLSVSRRIGGAVKRNAVKRKLREILRQMDIAGNWSVVVTARPAAGDVSYGHLKDSLHTLSSKLGIIDHAARPETGSGRRNE